MADDYNRKTVVTFSGPVEVPGVGAQTLPAGTYVFKILDSQSDRHIVQIFNQDEPIFTPPSHHPRDPELSSEANQIWSAG
jgi:hypothetical protein